MRARNAVYDSATSPIWQLGVYEPVHDGWRFTNIGGRTVLTFIGRLAHLGAGSTAIEIGSGLGDTCRFLAQQFGCRVGGIDMNAAQVRHARSMAAETGRTAQLVFVEGDVEQQQTLDTVRASVGVERVDLVYTMDVLMLTSEPSRVIAAAAPLLRPGGWMALAEVTSGPAMTASLRTRLWNEDGMRSLLPIGDYADFLDDGGLHDVRIVDRTPLAIECFARMAAAFAAREEELIAAGGQRQYDDWRQAVDIYLRCFRGGELLYTQLLARA